MTRSYLTTAQIWLNTGVFTYNAPTPKRALLFIKKAPASKVR